jgi:capsular exopolysaccharide synthesis family protein
MGYFQLDSGGSLSRTFELLQRLEKDQGTTVAGAVPYSGNGSGTNLPGIIDEEIWKLVQRVFRAASPAEAMKTVVFSSIGHGDGCTWVCASTGMALAAQGVGSQCLVDANFRTPGLHRHFGLDNRVGLAEAMVRPEPIQDFAQQVAGTNLWVIPAGPSATATPGLTNSDAMRARVAELRTKFDAVLIDASPANLYGDAAQLGRAADGVILVLGSNRTRRESALRVKENFESANVRILGAVLNKRTFPIPQALYSRL